MKKIKARLAIGGGNWETRELTEEEIEKLRSDGETVEIVSGESEPTDAEVEGFLSKVQSGISATASGIAGSSTVAKGITSGIQLGLPLLKSKAKEALKAAAGDSVAAGGCDRFFCRFRE